MVLIIVTTIKMIHNRVDDEDDDNDESHNYFKLVINWHIKIINILFKESVGLMVLLIKHLKHIIILLFNVGGIYLLWVILHYVAAHLYVRFCVPDTIIGFLMSPFIVTTPYCHCLRWVVFNGAVIISQMWVLIGNWLHFIIQR